MYKKSQLIILDGKKDIEIEKNSAVVVIDVFRATSTMYYLFEMGVKKIYPVNNVKEALDLKKSNVSAILLGEDKGIVPEGFCNNSPSQVLDNDEFLNKDVIMCTSSGTKGICKYKNCDVFAGTLLNAKFLVDFLNGKNYKNIYFFPTNTFDEEMHNEDYICAKYIISLILKEEFPIESCIDYFDGNENLRFFKLNLQNRFPKNDFYLCTKLNIFDFILFYNGNYMERKD